MDRLIAVGKATLRAEGPEKVAGKAGYAADKIFPGMVWGKAVRSQLPHAKLVRVDTSKAKAIKSAVKGMEEMKELDDNPPVTFIPDRIERWLDAK